jgi:hypothetical protein
MDMDRGKDAVLPMGFATGMGEGGDESSLGVSQLLLRRVRIGVLVLRFGVECGDQLKAEGAL